jgi:hypothetical protein
MLAGEDWDHWIYRSTDSGVTWAVTSGATGQWRSFAMTGDATVAYAVGGGIVWRSITGGATWYDSFAPPSGGLYSIACSTDGMKVAAASGGGGQVDVYVSSNGGLSWSPRFSLASTKSPHISVSGDGSKMLLVSGASYVSSDGGNTWNYAAPTAERSAVSGDGKTMAIVGSTDGPGGLSASMDGGASWAAVRTSPLWADSVALSTDGNRAVFAGYGGAIVATRLLQTTLGTGGQIDGEQFDTIELQYIGGGTYIVRGHSTASGFTVR